MKAVEYTARVLADGHLEIPTRAKQELGLHANTQVRVILLQTEEPDGEKATREAERARKRHAAIESLLALRQEFAGMNFNLTEELVRMREMEAPPAP